MHGGFLGIALILSVRLGFLYFLFLFCCRPTPQKRLETGVSTKRSIVCGLIQLVCALEAYPFGYCAILWGLNTFIFTVVKRQPVSHFL